VNEEILVKVLGQPAIQTGQGKNCTNSRFGSR